jgi:hypothetical protein
VLVEREAEHRFALQRLEQGRLVVLTASPVYKCPAAPYEAAMLVEAWLERAEAGALWFCQGATVRYDLLGYALLHRAPDVVARAGLTDTSGWVARCPRPASSRTRRPTWWPPTTDGAAPGALAPVAPREGVVREVLVVATVEEDR